MSKTRTCLGCEGTGCALGDLHWGAGQDHDCIACEACDSAGVQVDRIPASDALADAETFNWYCASRSLDGYRQVVHEELTMIPFAPSGDLVWEYSAHAARAAFRAVPGLRGDSEVL